MESQWPAHRYDRPSPHRGGAAPGHGAWPSAESLDIFARTDEPAPARARDLPPGGLWGAGPGDAGSGRVELRPPRGSDLERNRGDPTELVSLSGMRSRRPDRAPCRPPRP